MSKIIGIDVGTSTTKIVGFEKGQMFSPMCVKASDPISSIYGAFGKFVTVNKLAISDVDRIMITGVGSEQLKENIHGIPTGRVDEFNAIGRGGLFLSGLKKAIIVSMGTGTTFVMSDENGIEHIGGTGVGGGTLMGLSNAMLNVRDFNDLVKAADKGDLSKIDLNICDLISEESESLPSYATASNFGKISDLASREDMALGIINLVFQTIGVMAVLSTKIYNINNIVFTGNLVNVPQADEIFKKFEAMFKHINFLRPQNGQFSTAVGAAILFYEGKEFEEVK